MVYVNWVIRAANCAVWIYVYLDLLKNIPMSGQWCGPVYISNIYKTNCIYVTFYFILWELNSICTHWYVWFGYIYIITLVMAIYIERYYYILIQLPLSHNFAQSLGSWRTARGIMANRLPVNNLVVWLVGVGPSVCVCARRSWPAGLGQFIQASPTMPTTHTHSV